MPFVSTGIYDEAYRRGKGRDFSYTPDPSDPELQLIRSRARRQGQTRGMRTRDELARGGLLGSGVARGAFREDEGDLENLLLEADQDNFGKRRGEALGLHREELGYLRDLEMRRVGGLESREGMRYGEELQGKRDRGGLLGGIGRAALNIGTRFLPGGQLLGLGGGGGGRMQAQQQPSIPPYILQYYADLLARGEGFGGY